jgi:outer membrane protein OmpA-like peptidoglycan-associated protein
MQRFAVVVFLLVSTRLAPADGNHNCREDEKDGRGDCPAKPAPKPAPKRAPKPAPTPAKPAPAKPADPEPSKPTGARVVLTSSRIEITEKVAFKTASAEIKATSFPLLDDVAGVLASNPQILLVRIEGHTDSAGSSEYNQKLSQGRADSVRRYLIGKGVDADRLTAKGFGETMPIADNHTEAGREQNRRVEFVIDK